MELKCGVLVLLIMGLLGCRPQPPVKLAGEVKFLPGEKGQSRPFSEAVKTGKWLILSGQLGTDPQTGKLVAGGVKEETRQIMENIKTVVEKYGSSMDRVVKCTVMLADISEWAAMNEVYVTYFPGPKPARSAFATNGLALAARVEIECWALLKK